MEGRQSGGEFASAPLLRVLNVVRHAVPAQWRARLRALLLPRQPLRFARPSGIHLRIANDTDWTMYTEVFRKGEYDSAIDRALTLADRDRCLVVDLGANVGFFTLRVIDRARSESRPCDVSVLAVEGSPRRIGDLRSRLIGDNALGSQVRVIEGLVGERSGMATLYEGPSHGDSSLFKRVETTADGATLPFVDLSPLVAREPTIHLLKCDIEGAELRFIRTYRDLLSKTRVAVFELHEELCDTQMCRQLLRDYGFTHEDCIRRIGPYELYCVWR